jgi:hypothetical protein
MTFLAHNPILSCEEGKVRDEVTLHFFKDGEKHVLAFRTYNGKNSTTSIHWRNDYDRFGKEYP